MSPSNFTTRTPDSHGDERDPSMRAVRRAKPQGRAMTYKRLPSRLGAYTAQHYCSRCGLKRAACRCEE